MLSADTIAELELLLCYDLDSSLQGIKLHGSAREELRAAARRLHDKGFLTQYDGGYLTDLGRETAEHVRDALQLLNSGDSAATS